jgi:hypothetical protein
MARRGAAWSREIRMRRLSFSIGQTRVGPTDPGPNQQLPAAAPAKASRRLADMIDETFRLSLARGDIATAEDLLGVLQAMLERERVKTQSDRRRTDTRLERARRELEAKKAARYRRY